MPATQVRPSSTARASAQLISSWICTVQSGIHEQLDGHWSIQEKVGLQYGKIPQGGSTASPVLLKTVGNNKNFPTHQKRSVGSGNTPYIPETCRASWISLLHFIYVIVKQKLKPQSTSALHVFFLRE